MEAIVCCGGGGGVNNISNLFWVAPILMVGAHLRVTLYQQGALRSEMYR